MAALASSPSAVALMAWVVAAPCAMLLARRLDLNPMSEQGAFLPVVVLASLVAGVSLLARRRLVPDIASAVGAALGAAWLAFALQLALTGTPYGYAGLQSDNGRTTASATRYSVTPWSSDTFVEGLPSEYPPLFTWLIGRASTVVDVPAWRLVAPAEVLLLSFSLVAGYVMWRRLVPGPVALLCSAVVFTIYGTPFKPFTILVLAVFAPWAIGAFTETVRGRLHWVTAGLVGGLIVLTYHGWILFGAMGILVLMVRTWRASPDRGRYLRHLFGTFVVASLVASPFVVPYAWALFTQESAQAVSDLFVSPEVTNSSFPFLELGAVGVLELVGLIGLVVGRSVVPYARPLLVLVAGAYVFWAVLGLRFVLTGHTTMFFYVARLNGYLLAVGGILVLAVLVTRSRQWWGAGMQRDLGLVLSAMVLLAAGFSYWQDWRPRPEIGPDESANYAAMAHMEPLPDCTYPKYIGALPKVSCLPVQAIRREVASVLGPDARPRTLSGDERLFAFAPWPAYMGVDRTSAGTLVRFDDRMDELRRLATVTDPGEFAETSRRTAFGGIDVFALGRVDEGRRWAMWDVEFRPSQFDEKYWKVVDRPEWPIALAIRRSL